MQNVKIDTRELDLVLDYVKSLEERVMQLEARLARMEGDGERADLRQEGYERGVLSGFPDLEGIDRKACENSTCERCGHLGLRYEPWRRRDPKSYRAFAACPQCNYRLEF